MKIKFNKYMVYYIDSDGSREGATVIEATSTEEAIRLYKQFYNVNLPSVRAVRRIEVESVRS